MASKVDPAKLAAAAQNLEGGNVADPEVLQDLLEDMAQVIDDNADGLDGAVKKSGDSMTGPLTLERTNDSVFVNLDVKGTGFRTYVRALKNGVEQNGSRFGYDTNTQQWGVYNSETLIGNLWHAGNLPIESGNWTPVLGASTSDGVHTYTTQQGTYTKIGNLVFVQCRLALSSLDPAINGHVQIRGLPFTSVGGSAHWPGSISYLRGTNDVYIYAEIAQNVNFIRFARYQQTVVALMPHTDLTSSFEIKISAFYRTS